MKTFYKWSGVLIWAAGALLFIIAMHKGALWNPIAFQLITIMCIAVSGTFVIYSFLYGAQPGHYVRFLMISLFSVLCLLILLNEESVLVGLPYRLAIFFVAGGMVFMSRKYRGKFEKEYRLNGRVNYFEVYFPSKCPRNSDEHLSGS